MVKAAKYIVMCGFILVSIYAYGQNMQESVSMKWGTLIQLVVYVVGLSGFGIALKFTSSGNKTKIKDLEASVSKLRIDIKEANKNDLHLSTTKVENRLEIISLTFEQKLATLTASIEQYNTLIKEHTEASSHKEDAWSKTINDLYTKYNDLHVTVETIKAKTND